MTALQCIACGCPVTDDSGDVVIDRPEPSGGRPIPGRLKILCHACHADPAVAERFHTMWGLSWLRSHYVVITRQLLASAPSPEGLRLGGEAIEDFAGLGYLLLPGQEKPREGRDG